MIDLLLVRHGQSEWNALGRWQGTEDPPLSPLGRRQAAHAASVLSDIPPFDGLWASDLERARDTAMIIGTELGLGAVAMFGGLRERHAGPWQGHTRDEIEARWPDWLADGRRPDGWESDDVLADRVTATITAAADQADGGRILAVAHGGVIISLDRMQGEEFQRYPNLCGRWLRVGDGRIELGDRVELVAEDVDLGVE